MDAILGSGGSAQVYLAYSEVLDRAVAIKVFTGSATESQRLLSRETEARRILGTHPMVAPLLGTGTTASAKTFAVLEYAAGGSTLDHLVADGRMSRADVLALGIRIASLLATAHRSGLVHGDVKLSNILVTDYGRPWLADWENSRSNNQSDSAQLNSGDGYRQTRHYGAPELESSGLTPATDIYALGVSLRRAIGNPGALLGEAETEEPAQATPAAFVLSGEARSQVIEADDALLGLVNRMASPNPADRPNATAVVQELLEIEAASRLGPTEVTMPDLCPIARPWVPPTDSGPHPEVPRRGATAALTLATMAAALVLVLVGVLGASRFETGNPTAAAAAPDTGDRCATAERAATEALYLMRGTAGLHTTEASAGLRTQLHELVISTNPALWSEIETVETGLATLMETPPKGASAFSTETTLELRYLRAMTTLTGTLESCAPQSGQTLRQFARHLADG